MSIPGILALGSDSFVLAFVIGPLLGSWRARAGLAVLFGLFDALATVLGAAVGWHVEWPMHLSSVAAGAYGLYVLATACWARTDVCRRWLFVLPALVSVDNLLVAGGADGADALLLGWSSAALAMAGVMLGASLSRLGRLPVERVAGFGLLLAAGTLALT